MVEADLGFVACRKEEEIKQIEELLENEQNTLLGMSARAYDNV
jgi:hypothetical protein